MNTKERSVEEIVEEFNGLHVVSIAIQSGMMAGKNTEEDCLKAFQRIEDHLTQTLQAERQRCEQMLADYLIKYPEASLADYYADTFLTQPNNTK
jgi:hypothetical protein